MKYFKQKVQREIFFSNQDFDSIPAVEINDVSFNFRPFVSVLMITWNQESYIAQAIESILSQRCDFSFELIIGEDNSKDNTRKICAEYQRRFPEIIRLIVADENVGMHRNFSRIWHKAKGKYMALCDGDDYWCDTEKLQKQVDWMEARPEFTLCGTYAEKIIQDKNESWVEAGIVGPGEIKDHYVLESLIPSYSFHYSSVIIRREIIRFPRWFWDVYVVDRPLYLLCAENGSVGFIPEVTSIYRLHDDGMWTSINQLDRAKKGIKLFEEIDKHFNYIYKPLIRRTVGHIIWSYMAEALDAGDYTAAKTLFRQSIRYHFPRLGCARMLAAIVVMLRIYTPFLYKQTRKFKELIFRR